MGGTLALYAQRGVATYLVCATRGEAGEVDPQYLEGFQSIAARREFELRCAAEHLGLAGVEFLDYRDSGMPGSPDNRHPRALVAASMEEVAARITNHIRRIRPQVILTFDPIGGYRHPDHLAIHHATVKAFEWAAAPDFVTEGLPPYQPAKLYFHTISRRFLRLAVKAMPLFRKDPHRWGRNGDIDLASLAVDDFPVHIAIDYRAVSEHRAQASLCHASQGGAAMARGFMGWILRLSGSRETFMRAYPPAPPHLRERDLFEGIGAVDQSLEPVLGA